MYENRIFRVFSVGIVSAVEDIAPRIYAWMNELITALELKSLRGM
ncbi:hypothetical protein ACMC5R_05200 [Deferribacteres bacterium DY0037]